MLKPTPSRHRSVGNLLVLFAEVNVIKDPGTRSHVWATKADAIVETYTPRELLS